jgi:hypothetical protein
MWRIRKSPFRRNEDPVVHMVELLSREAADAGTPLGDADKKILAREVTSGAPLSQNLREEAEKLIKSVLERERGSRPNRDPKSFLVSFEWAHDQSHAHIVVLTEEVIRSEKKL